MGSLLFRSIAGSLVCLTAMSFTQNTSTPCTQGTKHYRTSVRHIEGGGIGYNQGYTTLEGFFATDPQQLTVTPFLDLRGHVFDNGKMAANAGLGARGVLGCRTYGLNAYYDYRNTNKFHYNRIGLGLETLGTLWDFRINGYLPVGKKITAPYSSKLVGFSGNSLLISQKHQYAMKGADAELGFHFGKSRLFDFYAAAGPYYFIGEIGPNTWGGKARLAGMFKEYITLEVSDSYDSMFRNNFQCQLTFTLPFGNKSRSKTKRGCNSCDTANTLIARMLQPVGREEIIVVGKNRRTTAAIDPATGEPFFFVFVNNTSSSNGTYESPYSSLAQAQANSSANDIIYVFPGNGTTQGLDMGIILKANQKFWGSGTSHALSTAQGNVTIAPLSSSSPNITNISGNAVTLSTDNEVSGFTITSASSRGIHGIDPHNVQISSCTIEDSHSQQIRLEYNSNGNVTLSNLILNEGLSSQIFVHSSAPDAMTLTIDGCLIQDCPVNPLNITFTNESSVFLTNNQFLNNNTSALLNFNAPSTLIISGNTFSEQTAPNQQPLNISTTDHPLFATVENNIFSNNSTGSVKFNLHNNPNVQLIITNNAFIENGTSSSSANILIDPNSTTVDICSIQLTGNTFSYNDSPSLRIDRNGTITELDIIASHNTMSNNIGQALLLGTNINTLNLNVTYNTITNLEDYPISTVENALIQNANITITDNIISDLPSLVNAIDIRHEGTTLNFTATNNEINNCGGTGMLSYSTSGINTMALNISNNSITNCLNMESNAGSAIDFSQYANFTGSIANNNLSDNVGNSVALGSAFPNPITCLNLTGNTSTTDYSLVNPMGGTFNLSPCDAASANIGTISLTGTINEVQSCPDADPCPP